MLPDHLQKNADAFTAELRECFGDQLRSVILYGPAARGEETKDTVLTFMAVVTDNSPSALAPCSGFIRRWAKRRIGTPLFITPEYIGRSLDSFPLEFMEMQGAYEVVHGEDVLKGLVFEEANIRLECERELKGKLLHLRAEYLASRGSRKELAGLVRRSIETFRLVFAGFLRLKNMEAPAKTADRAEAVSEGFGLERTVFHSLIEFAAGKSKPLPEEIDRLFDRYVEELDKLSSAIDAFGSPEE
jgi:hypothetical protein